MAPFTIKMHASLDSCFRIQYSWDLKEALPKRCEAFAFDKITQNLYKRMKEGGGFIALQVSWKIQSDDEKNGRGQKWALGPQAAEGRWRRMAAWGLPSLRYLPAVGLENGQGRFSWV